MNFWYSCTKLKGIISQNTAARLSNVREHGLRQQCNITLQRCWHPITIRLLHRSCIVPTQNNSCTTPFVESLRTQQLSGNYSEFLHGACISGKHNNHDISKKLWCAWLVAFCHPLRTKRQCCWHTFMMHWPSLRVTTLVLAHNTMQWHSLRVTTLVLAHKTMQWHSRRVTTLVLAHNTMQCHSLRVTTLVLADNTMQWHSIRLTT
jgi:hypothetical protein